MLLCLVAMVLVLPGCSLNSSPNDFPFFFSSEHQISKAKADEWFKKHPTINDIHGEIVIAEPAKPSRDGSASTAASGTATGPVVTFRLAAPRSYRFSEFLTGRIVRLFGQGAFIGRSENTTFSGTAVLQFSRRAAGSACISYAGSTVSNGQEIQGRYEFLGGTGDAARLHGSGASAAVERVPYSKKYLAAFRLKLTLGARRSLPKGCGKPPPVQTTHVTASLVGLALSTGPPSTSARLMPNGSTISGPDCHPGGDLYGVFQYLGPSAAIWDPTVFGPTNARQEHKRAVMPGRNVVLLYAAPPNGSYSSKILIKPTGSGTLSGDTLFLPTVTLNC
jgi:hypothetical protein